MAAITDIAVNRFNLPLAQVLTDAKHGDHTHFELILATVTMADGSEGTGYTYTGGRGGRAIAAMVEHDLARPSFWAGMVQRWRICMTRCSGTSTMSDGGGIASFAISAVDIALWDARGKRESRALVDMVGGASDRCRAYAGGIDLNFPLPKLLDSIRGYLDRGFDGVKIKIGQPTLEEDIDRIRAVRDLIGPERVFMGGRELFHVARAGHRGGQGLRAL